MNQQLATRLGDARRPGDDGYDDAARTFFGLGRPALIVAPRTADEIVAALARADRDGLAVSIRSGGHSPLAHSTNIGGMVIDLSHLNHIEILDADRRSVRIGAGATWGQVAVALDPRGWALSAGDTADVGVGGLTLGGGVGWMVRRHGLTIDSLVGARVVTADGRLLTASADEHPDLFWALRGGGGNFGVVVDFDFVAQSIGTVHFATVSYRLDDSADLVSRWRDAMRAAPEQLSSTLALLPRFPSSAPSATLLLCYAGELGDDSFEADAAFEPLLQLGTVTEARINERRYSEILESAEAPRVRLTVRNTLVACLNGEVIDEIGRLHAMPVPSVVALRSLGGAFGRVPEAATAFAHRRAETLIIAMLMLADPVTDADVEQALTVWRDVAAHGIGTYINFQGSADPADLAEAYPPATYARLAAVKRRYDPHNRFALNHNIEPARSSGPGA